MECIKGCAACCVAPSISSPIPGMPGGKPAGVRCAQLGEDGLCLIFASPARPKVCSGFAPSHEMCGSGAAGAFAYLERLEALTKPGPAAEVSNER